MYILLLNAGSISLKDVLMESADSARAFARLGRLGWGSDALSAFRRQWHEYSENVAWRGHAGSAALLLPT